MYIGHVKEQQTTEIMKKIEVTITSRWHWSIENATLTMTSPSRKSATIKKMRMEHVTEDERRVIFNVLSALDQYNLHQNSLNFKIDRNDMALFLSASKR